MATLSYARYGKDNIRVYKVHRNTDGTQDVTEMTVCTLLEGDIAASWTESDNKNIVATDTQKQTVYIQAKLHPVNPPELFASILGQHFLDTYSHISVAHISVIVHRWARLEVDGKPHPHSFMRDGAETRVVEAVAKRGHGISLKSTIKGLLVLKSTGSQFWGFHRDEYTQLPETWDRILSTEVEAGWNWKVFKDVEAVKAEVGIFDKAWSDARKITLETFATENSPSVQNTMYKMSEQILDAAAGVESVEYSLPNKHYFEIGEFDCIDLSCENADPLLRRSELAQGLEEHWRGRRSVRTTKQSQWPDPGYRVAERCVIEALELRPTSLPSYLLTLLVRFGSEDLVDSDIASTIPMLQPTPALCSLSDRSSLSKFIEVALPRSARRLSALQAVFLCWCRHCAVLCSVRMDAPRPRSLLPVSTNGSSRFLINLHFSLCIRSSLSLFFGNMPRTARRRISPPPHFAINRSMLISFRLPGRVLCE